MRYGSTFTGIGALDVAIEAVFDAECAWQCEINPFCRSILAKHWPGVVRYEDIRTCAPAPVDLVCGGFPCQDVSSAGKQAGLQGGKRSGLWRHLARIIRDLRPAYVVVECVTSGLALWGGAVVGDLAALGYAAEWESVFAASAGAPHLRERTFILGHTHHSGKSASAVDGEASRMPRLTRVVRHRWPAPPTRLRMDDGVAFGMDRLRACGNAVCPQQAELALRRMLARI